jgi:glycosyltransferase involved in cell wall biosynthesis
MPGEAITSLVRAEPNVAHPAETPPQVAVVCDLLEEHWLSMDLVGDMLCRHLRADSEGAMAVTQIRPPLRRRFTRMPFVAHKFAYDADRLVNRFADYPLRIRSSRNRFDLFHLVDHSYSQLIHALPARRTVVTCHDLDTFRCLLAPELEKRPIWFRAMARRILDGFQKAAHVIAVSSATRDELLQHGLFPPERITVVHNGLHPDFSPQPDPIADATAANLLPDVDGDAIWLLNVGSILARKRLDVLLRVFAEIRRVMPNARLVRVGSRFTPRQQELARELSVESAVVVLPFLEPSVLAAVYRRATLLLHTAEAEGFGLPLVEAMGCGCVVVASDLPVLREVAGPVAEYCPVSDVDIWKETVMRLLQQERLRTDVWNLRRQEGVARAASFSWAENARRTAKVYREVLSHVA